MKTFWCALLTLFCSTCRQDFAPVETAVRPPFQGEFSLTSETSEVLAHSAVWRGHGFTLELNSNGKIPPHMVMVSFWAGTSLAEKLQSDPRTAVYHSPPAPGTGFALVNVEAVAELDQLAREAHGAHGFGCGNLELIDFTLLAKATENPTPPIYAEKVKLPAVISLLDKTSRTNLIASIQTLEAQGTRFHSTTTGIATPSQVQTMMQAAGAGSSVTPVFSEVAHDAYGVAQKSLITALPGAEDDATTVVIGAHLDSINAGGQALGAPGADDDASGVATMVETLRVIAASGVKFKRRVEFHAYAAEEVGLIGSKDIAAKYRAASRKIAAMLQLDMNTYHDDPSVQTIYLISTDTSATLRRSLKDLLTTYLGGNFSEEPLPAGTSDHRSWTLQGYNTVFPFEHPTRHNQNLHTAADTTSNANNIALAERFTKLTLAFLAHHAGLVGSEAAYSSALAQPGQTKDIALAWVETESASAVNLGVGAATGIKTVEFCSVPTAAAAGCSESRQTLVASSQQGLPADRTFFVSAAPFSVTEGSLLRFYGYDADNQLLVERTVQIAKKR